MRVIKRFTAVILTVAIGLSVCVLPASASKNQVAGPQNFDEYKEMMNDGGIPALSTATFVEIVKAIDTVNRVLTGRIFDKKEYFNFSTDKILTEICDYISEESSLDILMFIGSFPETKQYAEFVTETFRIDAVALRNKFYELQHEMDDQGNHLAASVFYFLGMYVSIIDKCEAFCEPIEEENCYEIKLRITTRDGHEEIVGTGVAVNTETGIVYGKDGNGIIATGFNFSVSELLLYAQVNAWMRDFGFCLFYDIFCYVTPLYKYNTRRIKFDYDGKEWMIQIWKGIYVIANGAEVGIYTREPGSIGTYYDCANDEQMMKMSLRLYHNGELLFERPEELHWWQTGFQIDKVLYPASQLTLDTTIEMKDEEMLKAFCEAVDNHYMNDMSYTVDGLKVNVIW